MSDEEFFEKQEKWKQSVIDYFKSREATDEEWAELSLALLGYLEEYASYIPNLDKKFPMWY